MSEPIPHVDEIKCCVCGKPAFVAVHEAGETCGKSWIQAHTLPPGWFITDSFPPGDDGIYYACSIKCTKNYEGCE